MPAQDGFLILIWEKAVCFTPSFSISAPGFLVSLEKIPSPETFLGTNTLVFKYTKWKWKQSAMAQGWDDVELTAKERGRVENV